MVLSGLAGDQPAPFTIRAPGKRHLLAAPAGTALLAPRLVEISSIVRETADAVSLVLADVSGAPIEFQPGEFFTLLLSIDGETLRRAYSASSLPGELGGAVRITIKRVHGGKASNYLVDHAREGDRLQILGPSGSFVLPTSNGERREIVLVAGGSGITPMMSIAAAIMRDEPASRVTLLYGNRALGDVIFRGQLAELSASSNGRFRVRHVLSEPSADWKEGRGILAADVVDRELAKLALFDEAKPSRTWMLCGPEPMMKAARQVLLARGVAENAIIEERFSQPHLRKTSTTLPQSAQLLTIRSRDGASIETRVPMGATLLEAGLAAQVAMPFSCTMGGCGRCKVKLLEGAVDMEEPNCLSENERAEGYVLACVARPETRVAVEVP